MSRYRVGRAEDCDIRVNDLSVSRNHAEIKQLGGNRFQLRDLDSTYGTRVFRDGEWVDILEIEVRKDTPIRFGDHETTVSQMLAGLIDDDVNTDRAQQNAPKGQKQAKADAGAQAATPGPSSLGRRASAGGTGRRKLWWAIGGGAVVLVIVVAATAAFLLLNRGGGDVRSRLFAACMQQQSASEARCACEVEFIVSHASQPEQEFMLFMVENRDSPENIRNHLAQNYSEAEQRQMRGRLNQIVLGIDNQCRAAE